MEKSPESNGAMSRYLPGFGIAKPILLALLSLGALPAASQGAWIGFRNDMKDPIVVQGASVVNGQVRWGKPHTLLPGEVCWDCIIQPGNKIIKVVSAKPPNKVLYQNTMMVVGDLFFSVQFQPPANAKLVPAKPPTRRSFP